MEMQFLSIFPKVTKITVSGEKYWCQENLRGALFDLYIFWIFFR